MDYSLMRNRILSALEGVTPVPFCFAAVVLPFLLFLTPVSSLGGVLNAGGRAVSEALASLEAPPDSTRPPVAPTSGGRLRSANPTRSAPLQFDSEFIRLTVEDDTLNVEGLYVFLCNPADMEYMSLFYPYPEDSLLGDARTSGVECRAPGASWQPVEFFELPGGMGARWRVPLAVADTLEVRTVYRQAILGFYARYIVATTKSWPRPLRHARFEIFLPEGAELESMSFPFKKSTSDGREYYLYEEDDFRPSRDIVVEWRTGTGDRREQ